QNGFTLEDITNTLSSPVAFGFTDAGRLYVAEKRGTVQVFDSVDDPTPTQVIDVSNSVHDYWDRGLLGFAVDPEFGSGSDYLYLLYTYDPANSWNDDCADPTGVGCVVNGRLSRFLINSGGTAGGEQALLTGGWCAQFPSHTIGDLAFAEDGSLLVSAGDGASFNYADHGGPPNPTNSCGDPLGGSGEADNEGGALRSQDIRTTSDPLSYDGTVLSVDKATGAATLIAYGFRNPFRIAERPGTSEIWVGDVGWGSWEEVNRIQDPSGAIENFGWPCYEGNNSGSARQVTYDGLNLNLCESLYISGAVVAPHYARPHEAANTHIGCGGTGGAISGLAFYEGGRYPSAYDGALFIADYSIGCIRVMFPNTPFGDPDKDDIATFVGDTAPVDLQIGPDGDLFFADIISGRIVRVNYNTGPTAAITAVPMTGSVPLEVDFDGTGSSDAEGDPLGYFWDLDGDGQYDDSIVTQPTFTYTNPGQVTVGLRVEDPTGASDTDSILIEPVANQAPVASISSPSGSLTWAVGDSVSFAGGAIDPVDGPVPASALTWDIIMNHCASGGTCHTHTIQTFNGVSTGSFNAPDHPYPSYLTIRLTATDDGGLEDVETVDIQPRTSVITIASNPSGLQVAAGVEGLSTFTSPGQITAIVGGSLTVDVPSPQTLGATTYTFASWSDGGGQTHTITVPTADTTLTASFSSSGGGGGGGGGGGEGSSSPQFEDVPSEHPFYTYIAWMAEKRITLGCAANLYCPNDPVTRAQMASFLVRAFSLPPASSDQFVDIAGSPHEADIDALVAFGITKGCDVDRYCPEMGVTRGQMASFLVRTFLLPAGPDLFTDDEDSVHEADINALAQAGITFGCEPTKFCPDDVVTRAEMAAFLFRSYNR
ncbi:MAG: PQQ-dependent sugar dehydrogenase, partial [Actinobacteria bacterium]|nr:PQQ-dependent sugar dehydrogenase [Actinomycetota bacterium]